MQPVPTQPWVKICANTNLADAQLAAELGADAVGFVFAPSRRQVTAAQVGAITAQLPDSVEKIGVFAATDPAEIAAVAQEAGLTAVQLHSHYSLTLIRELTEAFEGKVKLIQVVSIEVVGTQADFTAAADGAGWLRELQGALANPALFAVLLDAARAGASGGLGVAFSWADAAPAVRRAVARATGLAAREAREPVRLIVAGGLRAENVREAVDALLPFGVDVATGVEAEAGKKDAARLRQFLQAARCSEQAD